VAVQSTVACAAAVVEVCATEDACGSFAGVVTSGVDAGNSDVLLLLLLLLLLVLRVLLSQGDPEHPSASCLQHHSSFVSPHVFGLPSLQSWGLRFTLWPPSQPVAWCLQQKTFCCGGQDALAPVHLNGSVTDVIAFVVAGAEVIASVVMGFVVAGAVVVAFVVATGAGTSVTGFNVAGAGALVVGMVVVIVVVAGRVYLLLQAKGQYLQQ